MKTLNVLLAVAGGMAVGAALGILFAPKSGDETRRAVGDYLKSKCPGLKGTRLDALAHELAEDKDE